MKIAALLLLSTAGFVSAADVTGTWAADVVLDVGTGTATFVFEQKGETFSGTYSGVLGQAKVTGTLKGNQVEWSFDGGAAGKVTFQGALEGATKMKGTTEYGQLGKGTFTAEKK